MAALHCVVGSRTMLLYSNCIEVRRDAGEESTHLFRTAGGQQTLDSEVTDAATTAHGQQAANKPWSEGGTCTAK